MKLFCNVENIVVKCQITHLKRQPLPQPGNPIALYRCPQSGINGIIVRMFVSPVRIWVILGQKLGHLATLKGNLVNKKNWGSCIMQERIHRVKMVTYRHFGPHPVRTKPVFSILYFHIQTMSINILKVIKSILFSA